MDTAALIAIVVIIGIVIACSIFGIKFFIKYKKTRKTKYLILSIILGFVAVLAFIFVLYSLFRSVMVLYGPPGPNMVYGPPPF